MAVIVLKSEEHDIEKPEPGVSTKSLRPRRQPKLEESKKSKEECAVSLMSNQHEREFKIEKLAVKKSEKKEENSEKRNGNSKEANLAELATVNEHVEPLVRDTELARRSLRTVTDAFEESVEYWATSMKIPSGKEKTFTEVVDSTYLGPLSFLNQSRVDYISENDPNRRDMWPLIDLPPFDDSMSHASVKSRGLNSNLASLLV